MFAVLGLAVVVATGLPPLFRTLSIGAKMISEVSDGTEAIHGGV
jgi:hypothetical protein